MFKLGVTNELIVALVIILCVSFALFLFMLISAKTSREKKVIKVRTESKAYRDFSSRLQVMIDSTKGELEQDDKVYEVIGRKTGPIRKAKKYLVQTFSGGVFGTGIIKMLFAAIIASLVMAFLTLVGAGPITALLVLFNSLLISLSGINVYKLVKELNIFDQISNFMSVNYSQYISSGTYDEAMTRTLDALKPGTFSFAVTEKYLGRVYEYSVPMERALSMMKSEFLNVSHIVQYLDIVEKAENVDLEYKKSMAGIPENFNMYLSQKRDFTMGMLILYGGTTLMSVIAMLYIIFAAQFNIEFIAVLGTFKGKLGLNLALAVILLVQMIIYKTSSETGDKEWDNE